ncbi:zinc finger protein 99 isoform X2 [Manduca sexta]|uniref:C2H2-type domain-containing protein n=1 Tax=Manduca sexta TaxID=7130 RepID=A0A921ZU06_MANSE|nr:zinc finger protein 99 isoform X2 [Manduca sexta]KAG6463933.1 hypothetical protein O3G_MSEX014164 [Manduca sexta]
MEAMCSVCLCDGRKLYFIGETGFYNLYTQILNEIPVYDVSQICVRVCWECKSLLRRFHQFKWQVKRSYNCLVKCSEQLSPPQPLKSHLQIQHIINVTYPEHEVKREPSPEDMEIKSEHEVEHCEPETFVNNLERPRRKRKGECEQTEKEKPKKKLKNSKKSKFKNKIKVEKRKRRLSDASSDVSVGRQSLASDREEEIKAESDGRDVKDEMTVEPVAKPNGLVSTRKPASKEELPEKPQCVECGKMFSSRKTYRYHLNVLHKGQNRYPCPRCGKVYQWKSNLGRHMRSHKARDSGELYCETCDKRFASVATYRQHLRVSRQHVTESEFSFMCNECGKKFVNKTRLRDHIDWEHLKKIKFRCQLCNKPFKCHTSLYVHMQNVHRNKEKKDNLCHVCGKSYQNAAKLKYHIVAMHTSETPYQCTQCSAAFGWYSSLYRHVREVHYKMKIQPKKTKKVKKIGSEILPSLVPQQLLGMEPGPA